MEGNRGLGGPCHPLIRQSTDERGSRGGAAPSSCRRCRNRCWRKARVPLRAAARSGAIASPPAAPIEREQDDAERDGERADRRYPPEADRAPALEARALEACAARADPLLPPALHHGVTSGAVVWQGIPPPLAGNEHDVSVGVEGGSGDPRQDHDRAEHAEEREHETEPQRGHPWSSRPAGAGHRRRARPLARRDPHRSPPERRAASVPDARRACR